MNTKKPLQFKIKEEWEFLKKITSPFKKKISFIEKKTCGRGWEQITFKLRDGTTVVFTPFREGEKFEGMTNDIHYTLEDLKLL